MYQKKESSSRYGSPPHLRPHTNDNVGTGKVRLTAAKTMLIINFCINAWHSTVGKADCNREISASFADKYLRETGLLISPSTLAPQPLQEMWNRTQQKKTEKRDDYP